MAGRRKGTTSGNAAADSQRVIVALRRERDEALAREAAMADLVRIVNDSRGDLAPVFEAILEKAHGLCGVARGSLHLYDGTYFRAVATKGVTARLAELLRRPRPVEPGGPFAPLLAGDRYSQIEDQAKAVARSAAPDPAAAAAVETGNRTLLLIPLRRAGMLVGAISAAREEVRPFSKREIALFESFAQQAVIAMENARLITETREALDQQTATAEVLGVINSSPGDLRPVFEAMVEKARRLCEADSGHLALPEGGDYRTAVVSAMSPEMEAIIRAVSYGPGRGTAVGRALLERRVVQIADIGADSEHAARHAAADGLIRTILGVPLLREGEPIGAFGLSRQRVEPFTDRQIQLVRTFADQAVIAIENARLITETREALEQQTATAEVLQVINSSPGDLTPVFDAMLEKALRLCEAALGVLFTYDGEFFHLAAHRGFPRGWKLLEMGRDQPQPGPDSGFGRILRGERLIHIVDITDTDAYRNGDPNRRATADGLGARTSIFVAFVKDDVLLGGMHAYRQEVRPFSDKQIALLQNFAAQAVIAMENARLISETRHRTEQLQEALAYQTATGEVLRIVASSPDRLAPVFEAILERATELCGVKAANLYLHEDGVFRAAAARHPNPEMVADMIENPIRPGPGTAIYRAFATKTPVHIPDIADDNAYGAGNPFRVRMIERGVRAVLLMPLVRGDEAIGVVTIYRPVPEPFTEAQIELVRTFADQAVVAIENARLFGELRAARDAAEAAYKDLQTAQSSLVQAQKMAALGQLTAGIAHEIKNPLNFVNNFAGLSTELLDELKEDLSGLGGARREAIDETIAMLTGNLDKIAEHGRRADNIVKSMLEHSRGVSGERRAVDLNALIDEALNLAFHGARAQDQSFNITLERGFAPALPPIELAPQEMTRVFLNLFGNGFYAAHKRTQANRDGTYRPTLRVATRETGGAVEITIRDNGTGIPADIRDKLFQPFFTTKPTGEGTGLGLSISFDIVTQQHGGTIAVASEEGAYTEFTIRLPRG